VPGGVTSTTGHLTTATLEDMTMAIAKCTPGADLASDSPSTAISTPDSIGTPASPWRRLTVGAGPRSSRSFRSACASRSVPFLRLQGRWLEQAGFEIGTRVRVLVSEGQLVVELAESAQREGGYPVHDCGPDAGTV
jgi:hypothetical protein